MVIRTEVTVSVFVELEKSDSKRKGWWYDNHLLSLLGSWSLVDLTCDTTTVHKVVLLFTLRVIGILPCSSWVETVSVTFRAVYLRPQNNDIRRGTQTDWWSLLCFTSPVPEDTRMIRGYRVLSRHKICFQIRLLPKRIGFGRKSRGHEKESFIRETSSRLLSMNLEPL